MKNQQSLGGARRNLSLKGFTLAEVLITLGIIGIVAALTLPTVIQHHKKQEATARLKKFVSTMEQAISLSELNNGPALDWQLSGEPLKDEDGNEDLQKQSEEINTVYNRYFKKYLKTVKIDENYRFLSQGDNVFTRAALMVYFADGSAARFFNGVCIDILYDVNGDKNPNVYGRDQFTFLLCRRDKASLLHRNSPNKAFGSFYAINSTARGRLIDYCKENKYHCSALLEYDNWEFKDDYPYKL